MVAFAMTMVCMAAPPRWVPIGPQGAAYPLAAVDPSVPDRLYATTRNAISVSLDGGAIFSQIGALPIEKSAMYQDLPFITDVEVLRTSGETVPPSPHTATIIVQLYTYPDSPSLFVSRDGGRTWRPAVSADTGLPITGNWKKLAAVPGRRDVAFAISGYSQNFRTDDGGATWRALQVPSILAGPARPVAVSGDIVVLADEAGVFRTTDGGATWLRVASGLPMPPYSYIAVAADPHAPTTLWLVMAAMGTFRSTDAGAAWAQQAGSVVPATSTPTDLFVDGESLWVVGNGRYSFRSADGGRTWTDLNYAPNDALGPMLARDAATGRLYFGLRDELVTPPNLRYSTDGGTTLRSSERGLQGVDVRFLTLDGRGGLYASFSPAGRLLRRQSLTDSWKDITPSGDPCFGYYDPPPLVVNDDGTLFAAANGLIWRSGDGGDHWTASGTAPCVFAVEPGNPNVIYSRANVYGGGMARVLVETIVSRSTDGGASWSRISQPFTITDRLHAAGSGRLVSLARRQLATSIDAGLSWTLPLSAVRDFSASVANPNVILVADDRGMFRSSDGGAAFVRLGELPDAAIAQVAVDPHLDQVAYAVTDRGYVYRSDDGGASWAAVGGSLDSIVQVYEVVASSGPPSTLVAGTSNGIYALYAGDDRKELAEFHHPPFGHYFLSSDAAEISMLREGGLPPWRPTGRWFWGWDSGAPGADPVCRFWSGQTFAPRSSHFYTPYPDECAGLRQGGDWRFEGQTFGWKLPEGALGSRSCRAATQPLYRAYNNGMSGAPNHRFTTDAAVLDTMIAQGWIMEGEAATRVFACVPVQY